MAMRDTVTKLLLDIDNNDKEIDKHSHYQNSVQYISAINFLVDLINYVRRNIGHKMC